MSVVLLVAAVIVFAVDVFGGAIGSLELLPLGLALFAGSFLVGPVTSLINR